MYIYGNILHEHKYLKVYTNPAWCASGTSFPTNLLQPALFLLQQRLDANSEQMGV